MKFAIWDKLQPRAGVSHTQLYHEHLQEVSIAEKCGFDHFWFFEHHVSPNSPIPSPNLMVAAASVMTSRIRLGNMVNVLPYRDPLLVAEEAAMLDVLSGGRLDVGVGRGLKPTEFEVFCLSQADSRAMFEESIEVIRRIWADETFEHRGTHYSVAKKTPLSPPLVQRPTPRLWISAQSEESLRWAAERDLMFGQIDSLIEDCRRDCERYHEIQAAAGHGFAQRLFLTREVYVAETDEKARAEAYEYLLADWDLWNRYKQFARDGRLPAGYEAWAKRAPLLSSLSFEDLIEQGVVLVGSPATVAEGIRRHQEQLELAVLVCVMQLAHMPHEMVRKSMEMFAAEVMPHFTDPAAGERGHVPAGAGEGGTGAHAFG
ncbi:LLM class flavin-dependent oxidoreductase [Mesorhizobium sp. GR13]|jgi:alkanesulfonate monooxygenase SsuD/methylene tetrahydromethanopterin reductase-like flavin-dependent oxidoreductase (luciferase family)|uniref:LLM class flavin-dependent oxidoreductase n=1 Tax=Mesorhizobium sp. GR13 TaxID=2562308 RepID=UPI0010BFD34E|nr:LLM class flavin-dependent oxidoreductase [Mesorhizobium sp. GR13]